MLKELREKMARIAANARAKFNEITDDTPAERAAEIEREFDAMMAEHDAIGERIKRAERLEQIENRADPRRPRTDVNASGVDEPQPVTYRQAFHSMIRAGGLVADLTAEERNALRAGVVADLPPEMRAQSAGTGSAGGFTVPVELSDQIIVSMRAWGPMYDENLCTVLTTVGGGQINIPTVDDAGNTTTGKRDEGAAMVDDASGDVTFGQRRLDAFVYATPFVRFSMELAQDSIFAMETMLGGLLGERLGRIANSQLTIGDGTGDPNGIVTAASLGVTAASATAVTADEILNFVHSVDPAYRASPRCRVMFNDSTLLALRKLKDGQGNYLITEAPDGSGRLRIGSVTVPYVINQAMASMAANNRFMVYGDFGKYFVRKVGSPVVGVMRERFWPDLGIAGLIRLDGELGDTAAVKAMRNAAS